MIQALTELELGEFVPEIQTYLKQLTSVASESDAAGDNDDDDNDGAGANGDGAATTAVDEDADADDAAE